MNREEQWNRLRQRLHLPDGLFHWQNDAIVCDVCGVRLTTLNARSITRHNESVRHRNAIRNAVAAEGIARNENDVNENVEDENANDEHVGNENAANGNQPNGNAANGIAANGIAERWARIRDQLDLPPDIYELVDNVIICICCNSRLHSITLRDVRGHHNTPKHREAFALWTSIPRPSPECVNACSSRQNPFVMELTRMQLQADMVLNKLRIPACKDLYQKWMRQKIPDPTAIRRTYVPKLQDLTVQLIRNEIGDDRISLSVDETTDSSGRIVVHAIVTPLTYDHPGTPRLIHMEQLDNANADTICDFVESALITLWPNGIQRDKVLIYATDAAPYMVRSGELLRERFEYNKIIHVRCICHGLHLVAEKVRDHYDNVDDLVATTKKVFCKARNRQDLFKEIAGDDVPLPPAPVVTRWGTWIRACIYYDEHFDVVRDVLEELEDDARTIPRARVLFNGPLRNRIQNELQFITEKFSCIAETITCLEAQKVPLNETLETLNNICVNLITDDDIPEAVQAKMIRVMERNEGLQTMIDVNDCVQREIFDALPPNWTVDDAIATRYACLTSVDVERSFSRFKSIFRANRRSFKFENLRAHVIVACFQ